jgi:hypothetical protein
VYDHLESGGAFVLWKAALGGRDEEGWGAGCPNRGDIRVPGGTARRRTMNGDEIELINRLVEFDRVVSATSSRCWYACAGGVMVREEMSVAENLYFARGGASAPEGGLPRRPGRGLPGPACDPDDGTVIFIARRGRD